MENSLKGLIIAAGTIVTCLIISLGFFIAKEAKTSASSSAGQINKINSEFAQADKMIYDNSQISGSEVINAIKKFKNETMGIVVATKRSTTNYYYTIDEKTLTITKSDKEKYDVLKDNTQNDYINPTANFMGTVIKDANDSIIGIKFVQI